MYTLYSLPGSCSMAVHVILNELNQPVTLESVAVPDGQPRPAEYLKLNPRGNVPALVDEGTLIREGGAIILYLLDKHASPMLPKSGLARAKALEWLLFANATLHPAYTRIFFIQRNLTDAAKEQAMAPALAAINKLWAEVDAQLAQTLYICGAECSAADILLTVIANWGMSSFGQQLVFGENVRRMLRNVIARPAYQQALAIEKIEYKAAA